MAEGESIQVLIGKAADLISAAKKVVVFTGAGVSTESGISDFRSPGGIWDRYDPDDFTYQKFLGSPEARKKHWHILGEGLLTTGAKPNPAHYAIADLDGLGIIPAAGGSQTLPRAIGRANALEMLLTGRWLKAGEARRLKLVNRVVPRGDLWPAAERLAARIAGFDPVALSYAKRAITEGLGLSLEEGLRLESRLGRYLAGR